MVRELNMDTQRQNFWKESIHKEAAVRLAWHMQFSQEFANQPIQVRKKKAGNFLPKLTNTNANLVKGVPKSKIKFSKPVTLTDVTTGGKNPSDSNPLVLEMRPVTPSTKKLLYKGFSALGEGRYAYLQERKRKKPEQKYEFPITCGWEYGWKINDAMKQSVSKPAEFGRTRIVKDSFYRNNGVAPHHDDELLSCFQ